jgi:hypothetical protein
MSNTPHAEDSMDRKILRCVIATVIDRCGWPPPEAVAGAGAPDATRVAA